MFCSVHCLQSQNTDRTIKCSVHFLHKINPRTVLTGRKFPTTSWNSIVLNNSSMFSSPSPTTADHKTFSSSPDVPSDQSSPPSLPSLSLLRVLVVDLPSPIHSPDTHQLPAPSIFSSETFLPRRATRSSKRIRARNSSQDGRDGCFAGAQKIRKLGTRSASPAMTTVPPSVFDSSVSNPELVSERKFRCRADIVARWCWSPSNNGTAFALCWSIGLRR